MDQKNKELDITFLNDVNRTFKKKRIIICVITVIYLFHFAYCIYTKNMRDIVVASTILLSIVVSMLTGFEDKDIILSDYRFDKTQDGISLRENFKCIYEKNKNVYKAFFIVCNLVKIGAIVWIAYFMLNNFDFIKENFVNAWNFLKI